MQIFGDTLTTGTALLLLFAIALALTFEFVNGFHDTANAVATVIYTHSLRPTPAVVWSGFCNLVGVLLSTGAVAFGITALLPVELVLNVGSGAGFAMVFALLLSAIIWNLGTWYFALPASSSHTLIGAILGVGLANSMLTKNQFGEGVNWAKASEVGASLLISPVVGFCSAALLLLLVKRLIHKPDLYLPPDPRKTPPLWIRSLLILTCTGVSFAHGSNDGQKGMGLLMLILVGILPGSYALNTAVSAAEVSQLVGISIEADRELRKRPVATLSEEAAQKELSAFLKTSGKLTGNTIAALATLNESIATHLSGATTLSNLTAAQRSAVRSDSYLVTETIHKLNKLETLTGTEKEALQRLRTSLDSITKFIPSWVKVAVALALGIGTMIGWKRIVVTVGEKIGKEHLTYAQGASAELVAMTTIGIADIYGLPVSTTHVLSSGVAGTMAANRSGLQMRTLRSLALAWILTLPVCVFLGATFFALGLNLVFALGVQ